MNDIFIDFINILVLPRLWRKPKIVAEKTVSIRISSISAVQDYPEMPNISWVRYDHSNILVRGSRNEVLARMKVRRIEL